MSLKEDLLETITKELILNSAPVYMLDKIELEKKEKFLKDINSELNPSLKIKIENFNSPFIKENEQTPIPEEYQKKGIIPSNGMEKIIPLLEDDKITEVECLGPEKFLLLHRNFESESSRITLDKYEIESILDFYSRKSNIPRVGGTFKAIVNNLIINAIDSDFGGPRFIISKIHPNESKFLEE
jgi:hypothetical protein